MVYQHACSSSTGRNPACGTWRTIRLATDSGFWSSWRRFRVTTLGLVLILAACDPGDVKLVAPITGGGGPTFSIRVVIDTPYAVAVSLGWTTGVPAAQVRVHRMDEPYDSSYWHTASADSTGLAAFAGLLYGLYEVEATRPLTAAEMTRVDSAVSLVAGGSRLYLPGPSVYGASMEPDHRGSLVFSELGLNSPPPWEVGGTYADAKFFEVYNNSDTSVYLDGKYWGIGWDLNMDFPSWPCAQTAVVRNDPQGIWTRFVFRFPGQGRDYRLRPGEAALIAKAAIDHRPLHPGLYDLSHANFELGGARSADNPDVPNLQVVGLGPMPPDYPRSADMPEFLSEPVALETLPRYVDPFSGIPWVRIPATAVLDVWSAAYDWTTEGVQLGLTPCLQDVDRSFDRLPGPAGALGDFDVGLSVQRRGLMVLPDGRKVLQDANTSMVDFVKAPRTPGWIP